MYLLVLFDLCIPFSGFELFTATASGMGGENGCLRHFSSPQESPTGQSPNPLSRHHSIHLSMDLHLDNHDLSALPETHRKGL